MNEPGTSGLVTIIAGIVVAVIAVVLFIPIDTTLRVILVAALLAVGVLNVSSNLRRFERIRYWHMNRARTSEIRKHPDFIKDLMRLNQRLHEVLYENRSGHLSLKIQGEAAVKILFGEGLVEFNEKMKILERSFQPFYNRVNQYRNVKHEWNSFEFTEVVSNIDGHLTCLMSLLIPYTEL